MYATAHLDLVRTAVAERLEGAGTVEPVGILSAPARITTWGPRASSRPARPRPPGRGTAPSPDLGPAPGTGPAGCVMPCHRHHGGHGAFRPG